MVSAIGEHNVLLQPCGYRKVVGGILGQVARVTEEVVNAFIKDLKYF